MKLTLAVSTTVEESITFSEKETGEVAKRIISAISKPGTTGVIVRDGEKEILNFEQKHFPLIKELVAR